MNSPHQVGVTLSRRLNPLSAGSASSTKPERWPYGYGSCLLKSYLTVRQVNGLYGAISRRHLLQEQGGHSLRSHFALTAPSKRFSAPPTFCMVRNPEAPLPGTACPAPQQPTFTRHRKDDLLTTCRRRSLHRGGLARGSDSLTLLCAGVAASTAWTRIDPRLHSSRTPIRRDAARHLPVFVL